MKLFNSFCLSLTLLVACFSISCTSAPPINNWAGEPSSLNQYLDRLSEFVQNGGHDNYLDLLGFNFQDSKSLLMSTHAYFFGAVGTNYSKTRRFVLINPFDLPIEGLQYQVKGSPFMVLKGGTCGSRLRPFQICTLQVQFFPNARGAIESVVGLHQALLTVTYPGGPVFEKPLSGQAIP